MPQTSRSAVWRERLHAAGLSTPEGAPSAPLVTLLYLIFLLITLQAGDTGHGTVFCCGNAVLLAALLLNRRPASWWAPVVGCAVATVFVNLATGRPPAVALAFGVVDLISPIAAAAVLQRFARPDPAALDTPAAVGRLALVAGVLTPFLGSVAGAAILSRGFGQPYGTALLGWFVADGTGMLLMTPLILMLWRGEVRLDLARPVPRARAIGLGLLAATGLGSALAFGTGLAPVTFLPALLAILCACFAGRLGALAAVLVIAVAGTPFMGGSDGQFALVAGGGMAQWLFFQGFLAVVLLVALPVAASVEERERLVGALAASEQRFRALAENSTDLIIWSDRLGVCRYASPAAAELLGRAPDVLLGRGVTSLVHGDDRAEVGARHAALLALAGAAETLDYRARHADGRWLWLQARVRATRSADGAVSGVHWTVRDVSAHKSIEAMLAEAANTDMLTGIANRRAFAALLDIAVVRARRHEEALSLAVLDIDHFKRVNDGWGHAAGDEVLRQLAVACQQAVRGGDLLARIGGEEFALLMPATDLGQAQLVCERLRAAVAELRIRVDDAAEIAVTASVGLALLQPGEEAPLLMRAADRALYAAKEAGRDRIMLVHTAA